MRRTRRPRRIVLDPERKAFDLVIAGFNAFITNQLVLPVNLIAAGNGIDQRQGRQCVFTSFQVRMTVNGANGNQSTSLRWFLVLDKMPDQAVMTEANLLTDAGLPIDSPLNLNNNKRFRVLRTGRFIVRNAGPTDGINPTKQFSLFKRLHVSTRYASNNGTVADITSNTLYWIVLADAPTAPTGPIVSSYIRLRFVG